MDLTKQRNASDLAKGLTPYLLIPHQLGCEVEDLGFVRKSIRDILFRLHKECLAKRALSSEPFALLCSLIDLYKMGDSNDTVGMIMSQAQKQWKFKIRCKLVKGETKRKSFFFLFVI